MHAATGGGAQEASPEAEQQLPAQHVAAPTPLQPPQAPSSPVQRQESSPPPPDVPRMSRAQQQAQAQAAARSDPDLRAMLPHIAQNREQQMPGLWRREHWAEQPYVQIDVYQVGGPHTHRAPPPLSYCLAMLVPCMLIERDGAHEALSRGGRGATGVRALPKLIRSEH